jgi:hypothetical protein
MTVEWAGRAVEVDATLGGAGMRPGPLADVAGCDVRARQAIRDNFDAVIRDYLDFDGAGEVLRAVTGTSGPGTVDAETFLAALHLVRIGPGPRGRGAVFDYTLGRDLTDHVVAVTFNDDGGVVGTAVES